MEMILSSIVGLTLLSCFLTTTGSKVPSISLGIFKALARNPTLLRGG
jgi:hypothetical protein